MNRRTIPPFVYAVCSIIIGLVALCVAVNVFAPAGAA